MRDPRAPSVQPLPPRSLPHPHSSLWALAPSSCPAQRAQSPEGQREWGLPPQPGTQSPWGQGLPGATATPEDSGPHRPRPAPPVTGCLPAPRLPTWPHRQRRDPEARSHPSSKADIQHPQGLEGAACTLSSPPPPLLTALCPPHRVLACPQLPGPASGPHCPPPAWSTPACALPVSLLPCSQLATVTG